MTKKKPELLAPAGTPEAAWAALAYGADAVYVGLSRFSARAEALNFTPETLDELVGYAHSLGRRVYITLNTLIQQRDLGAVLETLALIRDLQADAVIVQDMGVACLVRKNIPQLRLHASTQLAVHNHAGVRQLATLGFSRVVLARELSLKEIAKISREGGVETEVFIHGALCYSYSGLCLLSSHLLGRSGNRGCCAYGCRQPFRTDDGRETLPFSMKDFSTAEYMPEILSAGVAALKIEGRMKSPLYVAAVTDYYRRLADGKLGVEEIKQLLSDIQTIFGRSTTDLYLKDSENEPVDPDNAGHRGALIGTVKAVAGQWLVLHSNRALQKHDGLKVETVAGSHSFGFAADAMRLAADPESFRRFELMAGEDIAVMLPPDAPRFERGTPVYCSYSQAVRQKYTFTAPRPGQFRQRRPVKIHVSLRSQSMVLTAAAEFLQTEVVLSGPFEPARQPEKSAATLRGCFEKLGDTEWQLGDLYMDETVTAVFVPVSVLNDARRRLIEQLTFVSKEVPRKFLSLYPFRTEAPVLEEGDIRWSVKGRCYKTLGKVDGVDEIVLEIDLSHPEEIEKALAALPPQKLRLALPVIIREENISAVSELIKHFSVHRKWEASNIGGLYLLQGQADISADWSLYTLNTQAALHWSAQGVGSMVLSPEDDAQNLYALTEQLGEAAVVLVYQHTPLMISATRPAAEESELTDRLQRKFRVEQHGREFVLINESPFSPFEDLNMLKACGARRFRIDLCYGIDTPEQAAEIVRHIISGHAIAGHTGNTGRELR